MTTLLGLLAAIVVMVPVALYLAALNGWQATFVKEGTIRVAVQGESFLRMLPNVPNKTTNSRGGLVNLKGGEEGYRGILGSGIYWVSILYPYRKIHKFNILASKLRPEKERAGKEITDWIVQEPREVNELLWKFPIPFLIEKVDLQQGFRVNFVVYVLFEIIDPYLAIFIWNGQFANQMATAIEGAVYDFGRKITYSDLLGQKTGRGNKNFTPNFLMPLNNKVDEAAGVNVNEAAGVNVNEAAGVIEQFGIKIIDGWVVGFDPSEEDKLLLEAVQEEEKQKQLAKAAEAKAHGQANARRINADSEFYRNQQYVKSIAGEGTDPNIAASVLLNQIRSENVRDSSLTTWVEGGGGAVVSIPTDSSKKSDGSKKPEGTKEGGDSE